MFWHNKFLELTSKLNQFKLLRALHQECGSVFIFTAVVLPIMLGLTGIAFDVGNLYMHKARLQNVADAAALAGARAFADSQANDDITKMRDKVDQKISVTSYKPSVTYSIDDSASERRKNHGSDTSPHPYADEEADKYIYNNLINLGNNVSTDLYSHFALLSKEYNPRTFYRVGLVEEVNLYFLPIIRGIGKTQPVGVEAIVLLSEDKGQEIPATVFSNLFTYTGKLYADANDKKTVKTTFEGQMYYTGDTNSSDYFQVNGELPDLYADTGKTQKNNPKKHSTEIDLSQYITFFREKVEQAKTLNACVELDMSNENERTKLIPTNTNVVQNINDLKKDLYKKHEIDEYGNPMYIINYKDDFGIMKEFTFSIDRNISDIDDDKRYYSIDDQDNIMYCLKVELSDGTVLRVPSYDNDNISAADGFRPPYEVGNRIYKYYVVDGSKDRLYYSIDTVSKRVYFVNKDKMQIKDAYYNTSNPGTNGTPVRLDFNLLGTHFKYSTTNTKNENYRLINFVARYNKEFTQPTARNIILNANVFHLIKNDPTYNTITQLTFERKLTGHGNLSEPIYIFDETENEMNIMVKETNERPVVIIHTGTSPVKVTIERNKVFNGTIYAPNAKAVITPYTGSTYKGNIVANDVSVEKASLSSTSTFVQENHLESDTDLYGKIIQYAQNGNNGESQLFSDATDLSKPPSTTFNSSWENWYSFVEAEHEGTAKAWFDSLNRNQKIAFWRSWDAVNRPQNAQSYEQWNNEGPYKRWYEDDGDGTPGWKKQWYFKEWANSDDGPTAMEIQAAQNNINIEHVFDTKVRLINPRLEANPFNT